MRRVALLLLPVLVLPACSDEIASLEERRDAYLAQAESVCEDVNSQLEELELPTDVSAVPEYADQIVELLRDTVDEVEQLDPPQEDVEQIEQEVLEPLREDVARAEEYAEQIREAAEANDGARLLELVQERPQTSADLDFMQEYGFDQCVQAADTSS